MTSTFRLGAVEHVPAESALVGGAGLTLVEQRPNVLECHALFLPAYITHTHTVLLLSTTSATSV